MQKVSREQAAYVKAESHACRCYRHGVLQASVVPAMVYRKVAFISAGRQAGGQAGAGSRRQAVSSAWWWCSRTSFP